VAAIAIAMFIAYQSTRPAGDPTVPVLKSWLSYAGHFGVYAVLAFCTMLAAWRTRPGTLAAVVVTCSLFGLALEVYQDGIVGREASTFDAISNVIGSAVGAGVVYAALPWLRRQCREGYAFT
jgi:VanZ family protein